MERELYALFDSITEEELARFGDSLENVADSVRDERGAASKLADDVLGKAGYEMTGKTIRRHRRAGGKKLAALLLAAALTLAAGGTAAAVGLKFAHKQNVVRRYGYKAADILEDKGAAANITSQNEHFRITCDSVITNGYDCNMLFTIEALDNVGRDIMDDKTGGFSPAMYPNVRAVYKDTGEPINPYGAGGFIGSGGYFDSEEQLPDHTYYFESELMLEGIDTDRELLLTFGETVFDENVENFEEALKHDRGYLPELEGVELTVKLNDQLGTKTFTDAEGNELKMNLIHLSFSLPLDKVKSPVYEETRGVKSAFISFTDKDGTATEPEPLRSYSGYQGVADGGERIVWGADFTEKLLTPESYSEITITDINGEVITVFRPAE